MHILKDLKEYTNKFINEIYENRINHEWNGKKKYSGHKSGNGLNKENPNWGKLEMKNLGSQIETSEASLANRMWDGGKNVRHWKQERKHGDHRYMKILNLKNKYRHKTCRKSQTLWKDQV